MKRFFALALLITIFLTACSPASNPTSASASDTQAATNVQASVHQAQILTVFAAASLTDAFTEIGKNFETMHPGVTVKFNFGGSPTLRTQLEQGAVADIFASANQTEMDNAIKSGLVAQGISQVFLTNQLLVILAPNNTANIQTLNDLAKPGLKLVLADTTVPAGKYARQILANLSKDANFGSDFSTKVLENVVSNETDVRQVVAKVQLGEADAGIVYISDAVAAPSLKTIAIPANFNVIAKYPIAALTKAPNAELARQFVDYVLSSDGQTILKKWGFTPIR
jgi:molybdate transport system substrate-binding protein